TVGRYNPQLHGPGPVRTLLHSPRAVGLRRLAFFVLNDEVLEVVLTSPSLTGLEWVCLHGGFGDGDAHIDALLASPTFTNLKGGAFRFGRLSDAARARLLARIPNAEC